MDIIEGALEVLGITLTGYLVKKVVRATGKTVFSRTLGIASKQAETAGQLAYPREHRSNLGRVASTPAPPNASLSRTTVLHEVRRTYFLVFAEFSPRLEASIGARKLI